MTTGNSNQLFVYSSLRRGFQQADYDYIAEFFTFVGSAKVEGLLSNLNGIPVATNGVKDSFINGELYQIKNEQNASYAFGQLDGYEGLIVEEGEIPLYKREITKVFCENGDITEAWVYWYNGDVTGSPVIESGDVLEFMRNVENG